ncbi:MAG: toprim domain-containing protein [Candidatus Shapirobacteria bacterium]
MIISELRRAGVHYKLTPKDIMICCPFHGEKSASLGIHLSGKYAHCFGCDWRGTWNTIAEKLHLRGMDDKQIDGDLQLMREDLHAMERKSQGAALPPSIDLARWAQDWRGIPASILKQIPAYEWYDQLNCRQAGYRILLPIAHQGVLLGWTARAISNQLDPKYRNHAQPFAKQAMFPMDYVATTYEKTKTVVLVEGPHDALAGATVGVPTLAILGTNNWSDWKKSFLCMHYKTVVLLMDGDRAGRAAQVHIYDDLKDVMNVVPINLHDGDDPGSLLENPEKRYQWDWIASEVAKL